jgi:hypothetical protein
MFEEKDHHIFLNISSGNTLSSNAFTISAMLYKKITHFVKLYYCEYDYKKMKVKETEIIELPAFDIHSPSTLQQNVLKFVYNNKNGVTKKQILLNLHSSYLSKKRNEKSTLLMGLNRQVIDKLLYQWKMIHIKGRGKNSVIRLNKNGEQFVKFI